MNKLKVSPSPHVYSKHGTSRLMFDVIIALIPAFLVSIYIFGVGALIVTLSTILFCILFEYLIQVFILKQKSTISDGSAILTGLLLAFNVPSNLPIWMIAIGSLVAIGIGKMTFGGLGNNPFNPALVGRVFLLISFPVQMTSWPKPGRFPTEYRDAITGPTPLGIAKEGFAAGGTSTGLMDQIPSHMELFIGNMAGSVGEIAAVALLIGFVYLLIRKVITWHIPVTIIGSIFVFAGFLWMFSVQGHDAILNATNINMPVISFMRENQLIQFQMLDPLFHILTGGVMLGAIYMATDYVTSPMTKKGMIYFGLGIGLITVLIRVFGAYPEGVSFAILIMNAFVPLFNKYIKPKRFGDRVKAVPAI